MANQTANRYIPSEGPPSNVVNMTITAATKLYYGAAAMIAVGTGTLLALVYNQAGAYKFVGVVLGSQDALGDPNSNLTGVTTAKVKRAGLVNFLKTSPTAADVGKPCWFTDDHTVSPTQGAGTMFAGIIAALGTDELGNADGASVMVDITLATYNPDPHGALATLAATPTTQASPYGFATAAQGDALVTNMTLIMAALKANGTLTGAA